MNKLIPLSILLIVGCATTSDPVSVQYKNKVVMPSDAQLRCPDLPIVPSDIGNLTDVQVAEYLLDLYQAGKICKQSLAAVKKFLEDAQQAIDEAEVTPSE